jgi:hypothetical protein
MSAMSAGVKHEFNTGNEVLHRSNPRVIPRHTLGLRLPAFANFRTIAGKCGQE